MESNEIKVLSNAERQAKFKLNQAFRSLPLDVQRSIDRLSDSPDEKSVRTAAALSYQKMFGKRPGTGMDCEKPASLAKPGDADYGIHTGHEEYCEVCDITLPPLEHPREYPGKCLSCVMGNVG